MYEVMRSLLRYNYIKKEKKNHVISHFPDSFSYIWLHWKWLSCVIKQAVSIDHFLNLITSVFPSLHLLPERSGTSFNNETEAEDGASLAQSQMLTVISLLLSILCIVISDKPAAEVMASSRSPARSYASLPWSCFGDLSQMCLFSEAWGFVQSCCQEAQSCVTDVWGV